MVSPSTLASSVVMAPLPTDAAGSHVPLPHARAHHASDVTPLRRALRFLRPEAQDIWAVAIFAFGVALFSLVTPIAVEALVTTIALGTLIQPLVFMTIVMAGCLALASAFRGIQHVIVEYLRQRLFVRVVADLAYRLPRVRQSAFDEQDGPELVNRFFDVFTLQKSVSVLLLDGLGLVITTLIGLAVLAFYHPVLLAFDLALILALCSIVLLLGRGGVDTAIRTSIAKYRVAAWLEGLVLHPRAFKMAGGATLAMAQADALAREYVMARRAHFRVLFRQVIAALALQVAASVALLGIGGWLVMNRQLTLGQLVAAELIVTVVVTAIIKLYKSIETFYDLMAASEKLGLLADLPLEWSHGETGPAHAGQAAARLHDVRFSYAGGRAVLDGARLVVRPGERVAVVGGSGTGKSTLLELLAGLREPLEGLIELDGIDLRDLNPDAVRGQTALVAGTEIFDGTVAQNILLGRSHLTIADARGALEQVGLLDEVLAMPHGLQTYLLNGGRGLSVGHGQLLMLARALVGRPRLLLLDATLDHMDADVRRRLLPVLTDRAAPWTLVVVSRLPEVMALCDRQVELARPEVGRPANLAERPRGARS